MKKITVENKKYDILIAPTWNTNFFSKDVIPILISTLKDDFKIKVKPHYMSILKDKDYRKNLYKFEKYLLHERLNFDSFNYLISDWSGIFLEYSMHTNKKSILINTNQKVNNEKKIWSFQSQ